MRFKVTRTHTASKHTATVKSSRQLHEPHLIRRRASGHAVTTPPRHGAPGGRDALGHQQVLLLHLQVGQRRQLTLHHTEVLLALLQTPPHHMPVHLAEGAVRRVRNNHLSVHLVQPSADHLRLQHCTQGVNIDGHRQRNSDHS